MRADTDALGNQITAELLAQRNSQDTFEKGFFSITFCSVNTTLVKRGSERNFRDDVCFKIEQLI